MWDLYLHPLAVTGPWGVSEDLVLTAQVAYGGAGLDCGENVKSRRW